MKKVTLSILSLLFLTFYSCNKKESKTINTPNEGTITYNGISSDLPILYINGKNEKRNSFVHSETIEIVFDNIKGLQKKGAKTFPLLSMYIISKNNDTLVAQKNTPINKNKGTSIDPLQLTSSFQALFPYTEDNQYKVTIEITDRYGKGSLRLEQPFRIKNNTLLSIDANGLSYDNIYVLDRNKTIGLTSSKVYHSTDYALMMEGMNGLEISNQNVYPSLSIELVNGKGEKIMFQENILAEFKENGINAVNFTKGKLPIAFEFSPGAFENPHQLTAILKDLKSDKTLTVKARLELEE